MIIVNMKWIIRKIKERMNLLRKVLLITVIIKVLASIAIILFILVN